MYRDLQQVKQRIEQEYSRLLQLQSLLKADGNTVCVKLFILVTFLWGLGSVYALVGKNMKRHWLVVFRRYNTNLLLGFDM